MSRNPLEKGRMCNVIGSSGLHHPSWRRILVGLAGGFAFLISWAFSAI